MNYKYVHFIGVDNLLVLPMDPLLIGIASEKQKLVAQKCVRVNHVDEEALRIIKVNGRATLFGRKNIWSS